MKSIFSEVLNRVENNVSSITQQLNRLTILVVSIILLNFGSLYSQCPSINFNLINFEICCYTVELDNESECTPQITLVLSSGQFTNITADGFNGFTATLVSPNEILITHSSGMIPFGTNTPIQFCVQGNIPTTISMLYDFNCGLGESCSSEFQIESCAVQDSCVANFEYQIETNCGLFQFLNTSSGIQPVSYLWNFGDPASGSANTSNLQNPTHQFSALCENYTICLNITAADDCTTSLCNEIIVLELDPPVITCPSDILLKCTDGTSPDVTGFATAVDNCEPNPLITYSDEEVGLFPCDYEIIRTWTVVDQCGHISTCEQFITVVDNTPPVIICPNDLTLHATDVDSCYAIINSLQLVSVSDACSNFQISYQVTGATTAEGEENASGLAYNVGVSTITYIVTDECGNSSSCAFNVTVNCEFTCPGNLIENSGFTEGIVAGTMPLGKVSGWSKGYGNPVVVNEFGCDNNGFIQLQGNKVSGDAIYQQLATPIKKGRVYELSACVNVNISAEGIDYAKIRVMAFNNDLPNTGVHPAPNIDLGNLDVSGKLASWKLQYPCWSVFVWHRFRASNDFDNILLAVENNENPLLGLNSIVDLDNFCLREVSDSIPCYLAKFDALGNTIPEEGEIDPDFTVLEDDVDMFNGNVNDIYAYCTPAPNNLDTWYEFCNDSCESVGGELPEHLTDFIENDSMNNYFMDSLGVSETVFMEDLDNFLGALEVANSNTDYFDKITGLGALSFDCKVLPAQGLPPYDTLSPFNGRDIIFVHGLRITPLKERLALSTSGSQTEWPGDRNEFYTGYWKEGAYNYWNDHTDEFLHTTVNPSTLQELPTGNFTNRYLVVTHASPQSFVVGAHSVLEQIANAMTAGIGVVNCHPGESRPKNTFGHNGFIIISHSDGAPLTDIILTTSDLSRNPPLSTLLGDVSFIADRCELHVAIQGAFGGSNYATVALMAASPGLAYVAPLANPFLGVSNIPSAGWLFTSELLDLSITKHLWHRFMDDVPICVLTLAGGHPSDYGLDKQFWVPSLLVKHGIHRGFDDGVLSIESQSANPDSRIFYPNVYKPDPGLLSLFSGNNERIYDMGINTERAIRYYMDQKVDPDPSKATYASAASIPWLSPTGMVQPVKDSRIPGLAGFDALKRYGNHYSFLQSTSDHYQGSTDFRNYRDYEKTYDTGSRNFEESRVVTSQDVYDKCGVNASKLVQVEYIRGKSITIGFKIFRRKFSYTRWIWKRKYHLLENYETKHQLNYLYESVLK